MTTMHSNESDSKNTMPDNFVIQPVILCGGDGTRLWPASRKALPKQFMPLRGTTLFKDTLERALTLPGAISPVVICNTEHRFLAAVQVQETLQLPNMLAVGTIDILLEPCGRNTAPAIALAALHLLDADPLLLVLPSDHELSDMVEYHKAVKVGCIAAQAGKLVTFGVLPSRPETGYGYIQKGEASTPGAFAVHRFVEKPDAATAEKFIATGEYYWNSGMFLFRASTYLKELETFAPDILTACKEAYAHRASDLDFIRIGTEELGKSPSDSIDYAVMEHTSHACVVPLVTGWSDLGSWQSLYSGEPQDSMGNAFSGDVISENCRNSFVMAQHRLVATVGLDDVVVVETPDAVMVAHKDCSQEIKKIVAHLKENGRTEAEMHSRVYRPWGSYESLITGTRFQVKRIMVNPGQQLSLQKHFHRAEHWVVVSGVARVTLGDAQMLLNEDESTYIPVRGIHRLANPGELPLEIIEVQTGKYLGEDDIVRLEDVYGR